LPALRTALLSSVHSLKEGAHGATAGRARRRLLGALVVGQFALALVLSVGAGLLIRSFVRLLDTSPGFRAEHAVTASVTLPSGRYTTGAQLKAFYRAAVENAAALPGVTAAGAALDRALLTRERRTFSPDPSATLRPGITRVIAATWVTGRYFEALG